MESSEYDVLECLYFKKPGTMNTQATLEAASRRAGALGVKRVVVATCTGDTAFKAREVLPEGVEIIAVTHVSGFKEPNVLELSEEAARGLEDKGVKILTTGHAFGGVGRAFRNKTGSFQVDEVMAFTLRTMGQGIKVVAEISMMAADAGLVRTDEDVICVAGSARGADTAVVLRPVNSSQFFDMKIKEILCKPSGL